MSKGNITSYNVPIAAHNLKLPVLDLGGRSALYYKKDLSLGNQLRPVQAYACDLDTNVTSKCCVYIVLYLRSPS